MFDESLAPPSRQAEQAGMEISSSLSKFSDIVHFFWFPRYVHHFEMDCASRWTAVSGRDTLQFTCSGSSLSLDCKSEIMKFSNTISKVFLLLCCCYNHWLNRQLQWTTTEVRHLFCIFRAYLWCHRRIISTRRHLDLEPTPRFYQRRWHGYGDKVVPQID